MSGELHPLVTAQRVAPAATAELPGLAALVDRLALAEPMARQLVTRPSPTASCGGPRTASPRPATSLASFTQPPSATREREIATVAESTGPDESLPPTAADIAAVGAFRATAPRRPLAGCGRGWR
ncbi:MAG TPA: hypothetical protein VIJ07_26365 [Dermatophilaceae bacterium]